MKIQLLSLARPLMAAALLLAITPICVHAADSAPSTASTVDKSGTVSTSQLSLNDAQIADFVRAANEGKVQQGILAVKLTTNPEVRKFARMMIRQHAGANRKLGRVTKAQNISPQESPSAIAFKQEGERTLATLKPLKGPEFDRAYVDAQVKAHQDVLAAMDQDLMPNAKDEKLQSMLKETRPALQKHLQHATYLQAKLWGKTAPRTTTDQG